MAGGGERVRRVETAVPFLPVCARVCVCVER